jgi:hypothetical protein
MSIEIEIKPGLTIPAFLIGEVQSKLAYVDENILAARLAPAGDMITLQVRQPLEASARQALEDKVQTRRAGHGSGRLQAQGSGSGRLR